MGDTIKPLDSSLIWSSVRLLGYKFTTLPETKMPVSLELEAWLHSSPFFSLSPSLSSSLYSIHLKPSSQNNSLFIWSIDFGLVCSSSKLSIFSFSQSLHTFLSHLSISIKYSVLMLSFSFLISLTCSSGIHHLRTS